MSEVPLVRICPSCNKPIIYKSKDGYKYAISRNTKCQKCAVSQLAKNILKRNRQSDYIKLQWFKEFSGESIKEGNTSSISSGSS